MAVAAEVIPIPPSLPRSASPGLLLPWSAGRLWKVRGRGKPMVENAYEGGAQEGKF